MTPKTLSGDALRVCVTCDVRHYENCDVCWGFGVTHKTFAEGDPQPVRAGDVKTIADAGWKACPNCGSTPKGIPTTD